MSLKIPNSRTEDPSLFHWLDREILNMAPLSQLLQRLARGMSVRRYGT